jgi:hypothetical protein
VMYVLSHRRPRLAAVSQPLLDRLEKEVAHLLRCCAGALLTDDEQMLLDYTRWMHAVLRARRVPSDVVGDLYAAAVQVLGRRAPGSGALVERARETLRPS